MNFQSLMYIPRRRKEISIAVIGLPSSGKSYLLCDMVAALGEMGFKQEKLPLAYPYSSVGSFLYDAFTKKGGMSQTGRLACRIENNYGMYVYNPQNRQRLSIKFLNIPGETFADPGSQLVRYQNLVRALELAPKKLFQMSIWKNPSGQECRLVEPTSRIRKNLSLPGQKQLEASDVDIYQPCYMERRQSEYQTWPEIYSELRHGDYQRKHCKTIDGKYLLKHFFEFNTDSVFSTLYDIWKGLGIDQSRDEFRANHGFHDFYYLHYCIKATDLIVCDRLLMKENGNVGGDSRDYANMIDVISGLFPIEKQNHHAYLAFRGTDLIMRQRADTFRKRFKGHGIKLRRHSCYAQFKQQVYELIENSGKVEPLPNSQDDILIGIPAVGSEVITNNDVASFFYTRIGGDTAHGIRKLLQACGDISTEPLHHVFFTATPIDTELNFYDNDQADSTRFIFNGCDDGNDYEGEGKIKSFNLEVAKGRIRHMCFGSYQLLECILNSNQITI